MQCPQCQSDTKVLETRTVAGLPKRRRECLSCNHRFNTLEVLEEKKPKPTQERAREEKPKPKKASSPRQDRSVKKEKRDDDSEDYSYADREELESLGIDIGRDSFF